MSFPTFSKWLLEARRPRPAKNTAIDTFIKSVEELQKDVEKLSKYQKASEKKKKDVEKLSKYQKASGTKKKEKKASKDEENKDDEADPKVLRDKSDKPSHSNTKSESASFKNWLDQINEIKSLAGIDPERDLLFNNIFSDKLRVLVPLDSNEELQGLTKLLEDLGYTVRYEDLIDKKIIYKRIKTKEGEKSRPEKVGKALQGAISLKTALSSRAEELLDWWQKNSSHIKNTQTGASIVISRSPIDLVRMSDHDNITSCHDPKRSHFKCAKQEARTGGAIAYVVKNSDLAGVDLQKPELFKDKDRKIEGIVPLERLRLRRFNKDEIDLLLPELSTYGTSHIGFYDAVKNWAKSAQSNNIEKMNPEEDYDKFDLKGGTYQDTNASEIWGEFFGKKFAGGKISKDEKKERKDSVSGDDLDEEAERQIAEHSASWKHFHVYHDVTDDYDGDGGAYLSYSASVGFTIPAWETTDRFEKAFVNHKDRRELEVAIRISIDMYTINDINWDSRQEGKKEYHVVNLSIDNEEGSHLHQLEGLEHFLDYIDELDGNYETHIQKVYAKLIEKGYMKSPKTDFKFKNFKVEVDDEEGDVAMRSTPNKIGYLKDYPIDELLGRHINLDKNDILMGALTREIFNNPSIKAIPFIDPTSIVLYMPKNTTQGWHMSGGPHPMSYRSESGPRKLTGYVYLKFSKSFKHLDYDNKSKIIAQIKQLDRNWDAYMRRLSQIFELTVKGDLEKRNKMFGSLPKIVKPKPEFAQKRINFEDFLRKREKMLIEFLY